MVRVQRVLRPWRAAAAAPVQAEFWEPLHHGPPPALRRPHAARLHAGVSAPALLPLGSQLGLDQGQPGTPVHEIDANAVHMIRIVCEIPFKSPRGFN